MVGPLTYLDIGLIAICLISGLLAMYRGLTREVLSILSWALAAAATVYVVLFRQDLAKQLVDQFAFLQGSMTIGLIALGLTVFVVVLVIVHIITIKFSDTILDSRVGMIDRLLGFVFGVARGFLLVVIGFLFFEFITEEKSHPAWVREAQSLPYVRDTGHKLREMLATYVPQIKLPGRPGDEGDGGQEQPADAAGDQPAEGAAEGDSAAVPADSGQTE